MEFQTVKTDLFPHTSVRPGQQEFLDHCRQAMQLGRHLIAHAPTGIGKTAASLAAALEFGMANQKKVFFLTNRQSQHKIAIDTIRKVQEKSKTRIGVVDLIGKQSMCVRKEAKELTSSTFFRFCTKEVKKRTCKFYREPTAMDWEATPGILHVEEFRKAAMEAGICPYYFALEKAAPAHIIIGDYNHIFSDVRDGLFNRWELQLKDCILIVDEAHNLPDRIKSNYGHDLTTNSIDLAIQECEEADLADATRILEDFKLNLEHIYDTSRMDGTLKPTATGNGERLIRKLSIEDMPEKFLGDALEVLAEAVGKLTNGDAETHVTTADVLRLLSDWRRFGDAGLRYIQGEDGYMRLKVTLLDPGIVAGGIMNQAHASIIMSGTLRPPMVMRYVLNLDGRRTSAKQYKSPFPPENKPTFISKGFTTKFKERSPELWTRISYEIQATNIQRPGNVAIFAASYKIVNDVKNSLMLQGNQKPIIVEDSKWSKRERDAVLDRLRHYQHRGGCILMGVLGGSFSEGVDFNGNLLEAIFIVGLPLAPPDLEVSAQIEYYEKKFPGNGNLYAYTIPAMNKVLQAMGRGIRSETDKCSVHLMDSRYWSKPYHGILPDEVPFQTSEV